MRAPCFLSYPFETAVALFVNSAAALYDCDAMLLLPTFHLGRFASPAPPHTSMVGISFASRNACSITLLLSLVTFGESFTPGVTQKG